MVRPMVNRCCSACYRGSGAIPLSLWPVHMQFTFYMSPDEELQFFEYLFSRGAYCLPRYWQTHPMPAVRTPSPFVEDRTFRLRELMIFKEALFAYETACEPRWAQFWRPGNLYTTRTHPGFE